VQIISPSIVKGEGAILGAEDEMDEDVGE